MAILLKNVRLETGYAYDQTFVTATKTAIVDILIDKGTFVDIAPNMEVTNISDDTIVVDAKEQLLVPSLREMHIHIDKTYFGGEWKAPVPTTEGIFSRFKEEAILLPQQLEVAEARAHAVVQHYIELGHTHIRTHVNVDPHIQTKHMEIVQRVLEQYREQITYEIVAFPQHGLLRNGPAFVEIFEQALQMGATHVGGVDPAIVDRNSSEIVKMLFDLAERYNLGVDIHLHEQNTLGEYQMHQILDEIERRSFTNDVTISHAFTLADLPQQSLESLVARMAANRVGVTTTVVVGAAPITLPVKYLHDHGVHVSLGHDSLIDHWSPFGSGDTIQKLNRLCERFGYIDEWHIGQSLKYATGGITPLNEAGEQQWPKVGDVANGLLVDAVSSAHLIARRCPITTVIAEGRIIHEKQLELKGAFR